MSVTFKTVRVSADNIFKAMREFDEQYSDSHDYDGWFSKGNYKYALQHDERFYPVKYILSKATGIASSDFSGGDQANTVFRDLGFQIVPKPSQPANS